MKIASSLLELIGNTPLVALSKVVDPDGPRIVAKLEYLNPRGSVKDRIGIALVEAGEKSGKLKPGGTVVEPTSGNTGAGLALACAAKGYQLVCVLPDKVPKEKIRLLEVFGVECVVCPTDVQPDDPRAYYNMALTIEKERGAYRPDQYANPANPQAHYESTGPEIWRDTDGKVAAFVGGMGTGGTVSGTGRFLKEKNPDVRVVGIDTVGSVLKDAFDHGGTPSIQPHTYLIDGIGEDFVPGATDFSVVDQVVTVTDLDAYAMSMKLAREEGIFAGSSSGAAVHGAIEATKDLPRQAIVVVLLPDSGERYLSKMNAQWLREKGLDAAIPAGA